MTKNGRFTGFLTGVASSAAWDWFKACTGGFLASFASGVLQYVRHRPIDWWLLLAIGTITTLLVVAVIFLERHRSSVKSETLKTSHSLNANKSGVTSEQSQDDPERNRFLELGRRVDGLFTPLQLDALELSMELLEFLKRLGPAPAPKYTAQEIDRLTSSQSKALIESEDGDYAEACEYHFGDGMRFRQTAQGLQNQIMARYKRLYPWYQKVTASYKLEFRERVEKLRNRFLVEGVSDDVLTLPIEGKDGEKHIRAIAAKLWELAYQSGEKRTNA